MATAISRVERPPPSASASRMVWSTDGRFLVYERWPDVASNWAGVPEDVGMIHLVAASDGNIYGVTRRDVFRLNTGTGEIEYLDPPPIPDLYQIVEGAPGEFYMGARSHLLKYTLNTPVYYR